MDPIMKLLEDDEDESIHSGADVEAFTAALNREVEASASTNSASAASSSHPTDHAGPLEHNSSVNHDHGQWQDPVKSEIANHESQQQEHVPSHIGKDHSSKPEVISQGSTNERLHSNTPKECDSPKVKQEPGTSAPEGIIAQQQSLHQMKNQQLPGSKQTNSSSTMVKPPVVTLSFHMLIPILRRHLDKDKDMQVQSIFAKLRGFAHPSATEKTTLHSAALTGVSRRKSY